MRHYVRDLRELYMKNAHGGNIYRDPVKLDYSVNLNPLGTPKSVIQAAASGASELWRYPDPEQTSLRRALAEVLNIPKDYLIFGNGAAELIDSYVSALKPARVLVPEPSFSEYRRALEAHGSQVVELPLLPEEAFCLPEDRLQERLSDGDISVVMLCSPNNPNGSMISPDVLHKILTACLEKKVHVFLDECFIMLSDYPENAVGGELLESFPNLFVLRSFTKSFAVPGLRLGYGMTADSGLLMAMRKTVQPWNISVPAEKAGIAALQETAYLEKAVRVIRQERCYLEACLQDHGFSVYLSESNYLLFQAPKWLCARLLERGILIRDCANYRGLSEGWFRIAVRRHEDNLVLAKALDEICGSAES